MKGHVCFVIKKKQLLKKLRSKKFLIAMLQFQHQNILKNTALAITAVALWYSTFPLA